MIWGDLTILAGVMIVVFGACMFVYVSRLEKRPPAALGEQVGAHKAVLAKLRKRQPLTRDEYDYATELVTDVRSPLAYALPGVMFSMGFFYVVGCLYELHVHGGDPSFRTFVGLFPMLSSVNIAAQLRRVAGLKGKLRDATVLDDDTAPVMTPAGRHSAPTGA
ncbi:hypothetical protein LTT02_01165 [Mycolicibacterium smegmatis]|uniref:hypothetical protein n=1 Tax=Mycolicibacterium smegmatis TaxID=1772 RepID=UPI0005D8D1C0|nr:hypothetical protein [Mycolicibacterium smegmatis]MCP2625253.1 hypothetical protein [Mycolicibacterium smegmatis]MDF1899223.1 hypothetical protein [Mycolicibacterium smegmatis]MDF1904635.1 hypothetical protein [Mycolicibacterium smegmatis]MDF1918504.1 hypothetical protein [Mycolicibacterium smegmatis]MDF1923799.1 hypothetical protein [Mycolicibacterium smegmatis]